MEVNDFGLKAKLFVSFLIIGIICSGNFTLILGNNLSPNKIEQVIKKTLVERVKMDLKDISETNIKVWIKNRKSLKYIPQDAVSFKVKTSPNSSYLGHTVIPVFFYDKNNKFITKNSLNIQLKAFYPLVRSNKTIKKGAIITHSDIQIETTDLYGKSKNVIYDLTKIIGREARCTISKGTFLTEYMLRDKPIIRLSDSVTALYKNNNLVLKLKAIALDSGTIGETIRVRCLFKNKILKGEILDSKEVKIHIN